MGFKYVIGVSGAPGAGKSTFCKTLKKYLLEMKRSVKVFNLDPGCEVNLAYKPDWNITDFITVSDVMREMVLGPNGGLMEVMTTFFEDFDHVSYEIEKSQDGFFILDLPGQVELYTHRSPIKDFYQRLQEMKIAVCNVFMFDSNILLTPDFFIAYSMNVTMSMLHLGVPALSMLTKVDVLYNANQKEKLDFPFHDYIASDFSTLGTRLCGYGFPLEKKYRRLTQLLAETNESYGLVRYLPFTSADDRFVGYVLFELERALGYIYPRRTHQSEVGGGFIASTSNGEKELSEYVDAFMERCTKKTKKVRKPKE